MCACESGASMGFLLSTLQYNYLVFMVNNSNCDKKNQFFLLLLLVSGCLSGVSQTKSIGTCSFSFLRAYAALLFDIYVYAYIAI